MPDLLRNLGLRDIVDIALVAIFLHTMILWARRAHVGRILGGIAILAGVYLLARFFNLQLTVWIFQGFFAVFLIVLVVIFQEELRQLFERIAAWGLESKRHRPESGSSLAESIVLALTRMAAHKVGALIVLRGRDPLGRHISGGVLLDAELSAPLLESLFDPHSAGHDGAVLIEEGRVSRFAAHLPLSENFAQLANRGTRHAAALGLAERTDAACLVVSEERGCMSVAAGGSLHEFANTRELSAFLQTFLGGASRPQPDRLTIRQRWSDKGIAVGVAAFAWYLFVSDPTVEQRTFDIPVAINNLPAGLDVVAIDPERVELTLNGNRLAFDLLNLNELEIQLDGTGLATGPATLIVVEENVRRPANLNVISIVPSRVSIRTEPTPPGG